MSTLRVAAVQITTSGDVKANLELAEDYIRRAAAEGARLIVLPEATSQAFNTGRLDTHAEEIDGVFGTRVRELSEELGVAIVAGMFRPADTVKSGEGKTIHRVYNTALVSAPGVHEGYDKIHTYDAFDYAESDTVCPGEDLLVVDIEGIGVGVAVCYDVRFPEQFIELARLGAEIIVLPTSWADGPGKLEQWRVLSVARALDSTSVIVAAGQARPGGQEQGRKASEPTGIGHSAIVSADGRRVAEAGYEPEILVADINTEEIKKARRALPML